MTPVEFAADIDATIAHPESYAHRTAKELLVGWLRECAAAVGLDGLAQFPGASECRQCERIKSECEWPHCLTASLSWRVNRPAPSWGVWLEYPVLSDATGIDRVWDEIDPKWQQRPPTYDEVIDRGYRPTAIIDIAIQHKGRIAYAIEIVHKHRCEPRKIGFLREHLTIIEIPSYWVLGQVDRPATIPAEFFL